MVADPLRTLREDEAAELRRGEGHDQQRRDTGQNLGERADARAREGDHHGGINRHGHVAQQAVGGHRRHVGPQHAGNDHRGHRHGSQHADHRPLRHDGIERMQGDIDAQARHGLDQQQPEMKHRGLHLPGLDAAEGDEEHQENQCRGDHLPRPGLQSRHLTAEERPDDHGRRHGHGLYVAVQRFEHMHDPAYLPSGRSRAPGPMPAAPSPWPRSPCRRHGRPAASTPRPSPCPSPSSTKRRPRR